MRRCARKAYFMVNKTSKDWLNLCRLNICFFLNQPFCMQFSRWCVLWERFEVMKARTEGKNSRFLTTILLNCFFNDGDFMQILSPPFIIWDSVRDKRRWKGEFYHDSWRNFKWKEKNVKLVVEENISGMFTSLRFFVEIEKFENLFFIKFCWGLENKQKNLDEIIFDSLMWQALQQGWKNRLTEIFLQFSSNWWWRGFSRMFFETIFT